MILSSLELLYLAAYFILLYEFVTMRHMVVCSESDARMFMEYELRLCLANSRAEYQKLFAAEKLYWNRK